ncbi:F-box protein SKIP28-like [Cucurbita pepo subsp. pepo]|uniref:F-box protein SKIP28-like n=1 Tax=Cucurbita pepo subsp. pepo TaxID=3664 RepID=UPI000C9D623E|nr:F-box protein SKIP28-like [Cucurbita pepo subsp. pepo]
MSENKKFPNQVAVCGSSSPGVRIAAGPPHEALFLVLSYLPLFEILSMGAVCVSLRDAVEHDVLPWLHLAVDRPLSSRLNDYILERIARKADGRLRTLALINCFKISDSALHEVVENNPLLTKLYVPGCTSLTPEGVIRAVETLSQHSHNLNSLMIGGIYNIENEHLEVLKYHLLKNGSQQQQQQQQQRRLYHKYIEAWKLLRNEYMAMIDVEMCPKCQEIGKVYDCSRERCKIKQEQNSGAECRGCSGCVPRCEECGGCVDGDETEEAVCAGILCTSCWLQLPKCNHCNRPYCTRHRQNVVSSSAAGFVCEVCIET